jgi:plasmid stabilization system protein ParE
VSPRRVLYRKVAQQDLAEAYDWYFEISTELAERFIADLRHAEERIVRHPQIGRLFLGDCRRLLLKSFSYYLYYRQEDEELVVHAILHTKRNPALHHQRAR